MVFILLIFLGGCTSGGVELTTTVDLNDDGSGKRIVQFEVSKSDVENYFEDSIQSLNEQLSTNCPNYLKLNFEESEDYRYSFTLEFSSLEDYKNKASEIIGREVKIDFIEPSSALEVGMNYSEDFTSAELLEWIEKLIAKKERLSLQYLV
ncbi:hypothetical protein P261_00818 [Lachnospiraceae bacterium TWA4]|nr:hypothetical protein P261_00818 [Lachnospiraceae bacterium TWA4]